MSAPGPVRVTTAEKTTSNWRTPVPVFNHWNAKYDFDIDAAANRDNALCARFYDENYDSLATDWSHHPKRYWVNPPFGKLLGWVERFIHENEARDHTILALLPSSTGPRWFKRAFETASVISFHEGRLAFIDPATGLPVKNNPCDTVFVAWHPRRFRSALKVEHIRIEGAR